MSSPTILAVQPRAKGLADQPGATTDVGHRPRVRLMGDNHVGDHTGSLVGPGDKVVVVVLCPLVIPVGDLARIGRALKQPSVLGRFVSSHHPSVPRARREGIRALCFSLASVVNR